MDLIHCTPWIRFGDNLLFVQQRGPSQTYDCRMLYTLKGEASLEMDGMGSNIIMSCLRFVKFTMVYHINNFTMGDRILQCKFCKIIE